MRMVGGDPPPASHRSPAEPRGAVLDHSLLVEK